MRREIASDRAACHAVRHAAFAGVSYASGREADLVDALRPDRLADYGAT